MRKRFELTLNILAHYDLKTVVICSERDPLLIDPLITLLQTSFKGVFTHIVFTTLSTSDEDVNERFSHLEASLLRRNCGRIQVKSRDILRPGKECIFDQGEEATPCQCTLM